MAKPRRKKVDTWKSKRWYKINAPKMFDEVEIGITPASKPEVVVGRTIPISMQAITGKRELQHTKVKLKIKGLEGETAVTAPIGHEIQKSYIGRITKRINTMIRDVITVTTSDNYKVQLTMIAVSRGRAHSSQEYEIRKQMEEKIKELSKQPFEKFFRAIVYGEIAGKMYKDLRKVFPLSGVHIVKSEVLVNPELKEM